MKSSILTKLRLDELWKKGMYPFVSRSIVPSQALVRLWCVWARFRGVTVFEDGGWIPAGQVGPLMILGHWDDGKAVDDGAVLPSWFSGRCLVTREFYDSAAHAVRSMTTGSFGALYRAPMQGPGERPALLNLKEALEYLAVSTHVVETEAPVVKAAQTGGANWPLGWEEAAGFLLEGGALCDVQDAGLVDELVSIVPPTLLGDFRAVCVCATPEYYYIALPDVKGWAFSDAMPAYMEPPARELRLLRACGEHVVAAVAGFKNAGAGDLKARKTDLSEVKVQFSITSEQMMNLNPKDRDMTATSLLHWALYQGWQRKAADIHFEVTQGQGRVRIRVDSDLHEIALVGLPLMRGVAQVVRDLAGPGCAGDAELPGSGRFNFRLDRTVYDVRVESCMTGTGAGCPKITIRLLDKGIRGIDTLGFSSRVLKLWKRVVQLPQGLVLVTGPTGSGKTSTMYAALREINTPDRNIQTAEDPIEIEMPGVNQSSVNHGRVDGQGNVLNFARLLRSILRQDPDNILVGELRDSETADVAVQAALTGHLVFSTLHVVTACDSVERLVSMGIAPYSLGQVVVALSGQRLVERLCPDCKRVVPVTDEARRLFERAGVSELLKGAMFEPCGCPKCHGTGYCGRVLVAEFFPVMTEEAAMITARARGVDLEDHYKRKGFLTMHQDVLRHVALGNTSLKMVDMVHDREWASGL